MKERPILFSGPMVRAILDNRKAVTRRPLNKRDVERFERGEPIKLYEPGDRLWVRETWQPRPSYDAEGIVCSAGIWVSYAADGESAFVDDSRIPDGWTMPKAAMRGWVSSLYMPRWASRITLEVAGVRVERLQEITEQDAIREGVSEVGFPRDAFAALWESIHGAGSWARNDLVRHIEFRRIEEARHAAE